MKSNLLVSIDGHAHNIKANRRGEFRIAPENQHFWTWLGGPMWPNATRATVDILLEDYVPYHRTFEVRTESANMPVPPEQDQLNGNYIMLGTIEMKQREPVGAASQSQPIGSQKNGTLPTAGSGR